MPTLFEEVDNLYLKQRQVTTKDKPESIYMVNRFVSLSFNGFLAACDLNSLNIPEWAKLVYLYYSIPKMKKPWNKYPKQEKEKVTEKHKKSLARICRRFAVRLHHGEQILQILASKGIIIQEN